MDVQRPRGRRNDVIGRVRGIDREHLAMMGRKLDPKIVLSDLFGSDDFPAVVLDTEHAAEIVIQRLLDASFEIKPSSEFR